MMRGFASAQRSYERMLAAGPPEPALFTVTYTAEVICQASAFNESAALLDLQERFEKNATITRHSDEDGVFFRVDDELEEIDHEDSASDALNEILAEKKDSPFTWELFDIDITFPEADEPDWFDIERDRQLEMEFDGRC